MCIYLVRQEQITCSTHLVCLFALARRYVHMCMYIFILYLLTLATTGTLEPVKTANTQLCFQLSSHKRTVCDKIKLFHLIEYRLFRMHRMKTYFANISESRSRILFRQLFIATSGGN